ncbi:MAG: hypothetical protein AAB227_09285 [Pseudomonadota bacterium]
MAHHITVRAGVFGMVLALVAPALAQSTHSDVVDIAAIADLFGAGEVKSEIQNASAVVQSVDGKPIPVHLAQEGKAAALFTGRVFFAQGKPLDERVISIAFDPANPAPPSGWTLQDKLIVHNESGLACLMEMELGEGKDKRSLTLLDIAQYDQRGRDVSCNYTIGGMSAITLYASFYPDLSAEDHAQGAVAAIGQNFTIKKILPVTVAEVTRKGENGEKIKLPAPIAGGFDVGEINGVPFKTSIWLAKTHGWHVKARATYAQSDIAAEVSAALLFALNYLRIDSKNQDNPTTEGADA